MQDHESYEDGILRAQREGLIELRRGKKTFGPLDAYSHLPSKESGKLNIYNSRPLAQIARRTLECISSIEELQIFELGYGSGVAAAQLKRLCPDAEIMGMARTPTNPYVPIAEGVADLHARLVADPTLLSSQELAPAARVLLHVARMRMDVSLLDIYAAEQELGTQILPRTEEPFIKRQVVGNFPKDAPFKRATAPFFYENTGPTFHDPKLHTYDVLNMLSPHGIAIFGRRRDTLTEELLLQTPVFGQKVLFDAEEEHGAIVIGPDHELNERDVKQGRNNLVRFFAERKRRDLSSSMGV